LNRFAFINTVGRKRMHRLIVTLFAVVVVSALAGCMTPKRVIAVSPRQFEAAYRLPSHWGLRTEFRRNSHYAEIDFYRWGTLSWSEYTGTWRTPVEDLPPSVFREARTVFQDGPDLNLKQKEMLEDAMQKACEVGLFAPEMYPPAPTVSRMQK